MDSTKSKKQDTKAFTFITLVTIGIIDFCILSISKAAYQVLKYVQGICILVPQ